jgi:hypothetical protein
MSMAIWAGGPDLAKQGPKARGITRFSDVVNINAFIAARPGRARVTYKTSRLAGLWQLDLEDLEDGERWAVGYYIDGFEDKTVEYDVYIKLDWGGYVDEELGRRLGRTPYVIWPRGGLIFVALPHEHEADVVFTAPRVCGHGDILSEPVFIWRDIVGRFRVLECASGLYKFEALDELEGWLNEQKRAEEHGHDVIYWLEWYVIPGTISGEDEWSSALMRAVLGKRNPSPNDVVELVRKHLTYL